MVKKIFQLGFLINIYIYIYIYIYHFLLKKISFFKENKNSFKISKNTHLKITQSYKRMHLKLAYAWINLLKEFHITFLKDDF